MGSVGVQERGVASRAAGIGGRPAAQPFLRAWLVSDTALVVSLAVAACIAHFVVNFFAQGRYGFFRDELYYAACGQRLAWGYVDQAPLIALIARISRALLGDSLLALRFFPALAAGAKVLLAGWMARELGGKRFAQGLAALAVLLAPVYLTFDNFLSMNAFEPVFWMLCAAIAMRIAGRGNQKLWLWFGLVAGLGILNKHSMLFFGSGVVAGLSLTPERRFLRSKWIWLGGVLSLAIFLPNLVWEARHGWPTLEILRIVGQIKNTNVSPPAFILQQALLTNPLAAPIWLAGLYFLLVAREAKPYRFLGWAYLVVLAEMLILKGKIYYLAPAYPLLLAAGAVCIESLIRRRDWRWLKPAIVVPLIIAGIVAAPLAMPILPVDAMVKYSRFWDVQDVKVENQAEGKLPQLFADMFGWENQAATVARVYQSLPATERGQAAILAANYGEAGAIDYFGPPYGLPRAISNHNSYYLWGPGQGAYPVVIAIGFPREQLEPLFARVDPGATITDGYAMPDENNISVFICREPKISLQQAWPSLKLYN